MKKIKLIEVRSEIGAGTRGASLGVGALKTAALNRKSKFFKKFPSVQVKDVNHLLFEEVVFQHAKRIEGMITIYERVSEEVRSTLNNNEFPVVLAGDHGSAGGTIAGIKMAFPGKRLGVVWVDAHADLHSPYTSPSGNMHGMPLGASLAIDNKELQRNDVDGKTIELWEKLKNTGGIQPKIYPEDLIFIGVRDIEDEEAKLIRNRNIKCITVEELQEKGGKVIARAVDQFLMHCDLIYISFDVDSMDPSISKGTGTPVPDGVDTSEAEGLLIHLVQNKKVCCFEVTEINPTLDNKNTMAEKAFPILENVSTEIEMKLLID